MKTVYHISESNLDGVTLPPRIPDNYMTKHGYEDGKIARVCFAPTISDCISALAINCKNKPYYVHVPSTQFKIVKPTVKQVPDGKLTHELWSTVPVRLKCIGRIIVHEATDDFMSFKFGGKYESAVYKWDYDWLERY